MIWVALSPVLYETITGRFETEGRGGDRLWRRPPAQELLELPEAGRGRGSGFPPEPLEGAQPRQHLHGGPLASRTVRRWIPVVSTTLFTVICYGSHRKLIKRVRFVQSHLLSCQGFKTGSEPTVLIPKSAYNASSLTVNLLWSQTLGTPLGFDRTECKQRQSSPGHGAVDSRSSSFCHPAMVPTCFCKPHSRRPVTSDFSL